MIGRRVTSPIDLSAKYYLHRENFLWQDIYTLIHSSHPYTHIKHTYIQTHTSRDLNLLRSTYRNTIKQTNTNKERDREKMRKKPLPRGRKSWPTSPSKTELFPLFCPPTTMICGNSNCVSSIERMSLSERNVDEMKNISKDKLKEKLPKRTNKKGNEEKKIERTRKSVYTF